jgi:hypothetical protein
VRIEIEALKGEFCGGNHELDRCSVKRLGVDKWKARGNGSFMEFNAGSGSHQITRSAVVLGQFRRKRRNLTS